MIEATRVLTQMLAKRPRNNRDIHLIRGKLWQQLLLMFQGGCAIDKMSEQGNVIAKPGTSLNATLPNSNRGSKILESLVLFSKLGRDLQKSASNTQRDKDMHAEALAPKFLILNALPIARPNNADKQGLGAQELSTLRTILATQNSKKKCWPGGKLGATRRQKKR